MNIIRTQFDYFTRSANERASNAQFMQNDSVANCVWCTSEYRRSLMKANPTNKTGHIAYKVVLYEHSSLSLAVCVRVLS